ncbi:MAG: hypothetical protein A2216_01095 [Omnitrophica WOR_2 bacterium RIFOXYA2_FULL_45_12]|nr:MAG: hypothetical protein A2216_01095 [Omnitrophica WOR_2 bacterium RIFOXYA2_FULL_45_12]
MVTFLTREELEFLDKLEKDMMFSTGRHLSRSQILQDMAELLSKTRMNAIGIKSDDELKKKIQEAISRMNQQDKEKNPQDKSEV